MVGNNAYGHIFLGVVSVFIAGKGAHGVKHPSDGINLEKVVHALHNAGKTLKAHSRIYIFGRKLCIVALAVVVELGEHIVPYFDKPVALAAGAAVRLAAAVLFAAVEIYFGAGTAGTAAVLPEIVRLAEPDYMIGGHAHLFIPQLVRLVVLFVDGGVKQIFGNLQGFRQKFPAPLYCLGFEIIPEREVAQHLEKRTVAGGYAYIFYISRADALLAGADSVSRRLLFTREILFHGRHAGVNKQQGAVVYGYERKAFEPKVPF